MFDVSGRVLSVAEGWHRGPTARPVDDPEATRRRMVLDLRRQARPTADMLGNDKD